MIRDKGAIGNGYIDSCKATYPTPQPTPKIGVVVGSDPGNIGSAIAGAMVGDGWTVHERNKESWPGFEITPDIGALILANSSNQMDWIENLSDEDTLRVIHDTLSESILAVSSFVRATLGTPWRKKIVLIGSMAYRSVLNASSPYCAAKAGLAHFARCAAWELAPKGYDVFTIHPSNTLDSPMTEDTIQGIMRYRGIPREEAEAYWGSILPRESFLTKKEIAHVVMNVLDQESSYMSGGQIELAGGQR